MIETSRRKENVCWGCNYSLQHNLWCLSPEESIVLNIWQFVILRTRLNLKKLDLPHLTLDSWYILGNIIFVSITIQFGPCLIFLWTLIYPLVSSYFWNSNWKMLENNFSAFNLICYCIYSPPPHFLDAWFVGFEAILESFQCSHQVHILLRSVSLLVTCH